MKTTLSIIMTLALMATGAYAIYEVSNRNSVDRQTKGLLRQLNKDVKDKFTEMEGDRERHLEQHQREMSQIAANAADEGRRLDDFLASQHPDPVLDELRRRYGDVNVYSGGVVRVERDYWKDFSLRGEKCLFTFHDFDLLKIKGSCPTVELYNECGLVTGCVRYGMVGEALVGALGGLFMDDPTKAGKVKAKVASMDCPFYMGAPRYYRVFFSKKEN